jgi:hypothetical protein
MCAADAAASRDGRHELPGVVVPWPVENLRHRPLLDDLAAGHHADAVRDPPDDREVVRDEQVRDAELLLQRR